jgi:hypothetical protein
MLETFQNILKVILDYLRVFVVCLLSVILGVFIAKSLKNMDSGNFFIEILISVALYFLITIILPHGNFIWEGSSFRILHSTSMVSYYGSQIAFFLGILAFLFGLMGG